MAFFEDFLQSVLPSIREWLTLLELENEVLAQDKVESRKTIEKLAGDLAELTKKLPECAIAEADREWRDHNEESTIRELETWFHANAESLADIALHTAQFHISRAIPDPTGHLDKASRMLQLARQACPENREILELRNEFDVVNAGLQEQLLHNGSTPITWNKEMSERLLDKGEALLPIIQTFRDVAAFCFNEGRRQLALIFADRAATLAESGGRDLTLVWVATESMAAYYHSTEGRGGEALRRIDRTLTEARIVLDARDPIELNARRLRALVLDNLGRPDDALAEIDAFAPIQAEALGERHPYVLAARWRRARVLTNLGRRDDALAAIDAYAPQRA